MANSIQREQARLDLDRAVGRRAVDPADLAGRLEDRHLPFERLDHVECRQGRLGAVLVLAGVEADLEARGHRPAGNANQIARSGEVARRLDRAAIETRPGRLGQGIGGRTPQEEVASVALAAHRRFSRFADAACGGGHFGPVLLRTISMC